MSHLFDILHSDSRFVVIDKPEGFHVHKPEMSHIKVHPSKIVLQQLRDQLGCHVYPVHRIDVPTSGCLLMALDRETASKLSQQMREGGFQKTYLGLARGWTTEASEIQLELKAENRIDMMTAHTRLRRIATTEIENVQGLMHPTARLSLLELEAVTGRFHQIRRHLNQISHPLIGDVGHGDRRHNQFFVKHFGVEGLCLRAQRLKFPHPFITSEDIEVTAPSNSKWDLIHGLFKL